MICILQGYRGRISNERFIPPGEYADDDSRLLGLSAYLVANGHAVVLPDVEPKPQAEPTPEPEPEEVNKPAHSRKRGK